jgi:chorismate mutase
MGASLCDTLIDMTNTELQALRNEIDDIDADVVKLLATRFRITSEVGRIKAQASMEPVDSIREAAQIAKYRELALENNINPEVVVDIFRIIIDEVVRNHRAN